jgi:hypothetical protein
LTVVKGTALLQATGLFHTPFIDRNKYSEFGGGKTNLIQSYNVMLDSGNKNLALRATKKKTF